MCGSCSGCHRTPSDVFIVSLLIVVTLYSSRSFYFYLFPNTLFNLWHIFMRVWGSADVPATVGVALVEPPIVTWLSYGLLFMSLLLWVMFAWSYLMAVCVPPGFIPFTFTQREKLSASLSLNAFYEPLPYPRCPACEQRRRASGSPGSSDAEGGAGPVTGASRRRTGRGAYPPLEAVSKPSGEVRIHRFTSQAPPGDATDSAATVAVQVSGGVEHPIGETGGPAVEPAGVSATGDSSPHAHGVSRRYSGAEASNSFEHFFFNRRANAYTSVRNKFLNFCPLCYSYRPQRAHHCSKCNRCILKYDHHCPWLAQCVGFFNYKNYLLVLLYTLLLTGWALLLLSGAFAVYAVERHTGHATAALPHTAAAPPTPLTLSPSPGHTPAGVGVGGGVGAHPRGGSGSRRVGTYADLSSRLLDELRVGRPTLGVFVCFGESLLFFLMSLYLLRRHFYFARHNITTIDVVIHEQERMGGRGGGSSGDDEYDSEGSGRDAGSDTSDGERRGGGGGGCGGDSRPSIFDGNKKHYRERTLKRFMKKNVFDLGVRRNLLQVFGDAELHEGPPGAPAAYFQHLMESDRFRYEGFLRRWFWRLLPFRAYPPQLRWEGLDAMKRRQRLRGDGHSDGGGGYGAVGSRHAADADGGGAARGDAVGSSRDNSMLLEYGVTEQHLLGLRFPTKASRRL